MRQNKYLPRVEKATNPEINNRRITAIYFLIRNGQIIYIGQTTNLKSRICSHKCFPAYYFDSFRYIECREKNLRKYETRWLQKFRPKLNGYLYDGKRKGIEYDLV
jgi:hypothetical protein